MKAYAKKHRMHPSDFDEEFERDGDLSGRMRHKHSHEHFMNDARHDARHDDRGGKDIHERHKDLLAHRHQVCYGIARPQQLATSYHMDIGVPFSSCMWIAL